MQLVLTRPSLDVHFKNINDLTGLEDFAALEILNVDDNPLAGIDLSGNLLLERLYCSNPGFDQQIVDIDTLDLSNNPNIHIVEAKNLGLLDIVNLKNGNNSNMVQFSINLTFNPPANVGDLNDVCIQVDDENTANQNLYPYSTWTIGDGHMDYSFSDDCLLGTNTVWQNEFRIFPNPTSGFLNIESPNTKFQKIEVYSLQGKSIKSLSADLERIDMRNLAPGMYFVRLCGSEGIYVHKIVKE